MTDKGKELMKETVENLKKLDKESMMLVKASIDECRITDKQGEINWKERRETYGRIYSKKIR